MNRVTGTRSGILPSRTARKRSREFMPCSYMSSCSICSSVLPLVSGSRQPKEHKPRHADQPVHPEGAAVPSQCSAVGKVKVSRKQPAHRREHRDRHGRAADAVGEDLGEHHPGDRGQRAGVAGDGADDQDQHVRSLADRR